MAIDLDHTGWRILEALQGDTTPIPYRTVAPDTVGTPRRRARPT